VSTRITPVLQLTSLQGKADGDFCPGILHRLRPEPQGDSQPEEALLQVVDREAQQYSRPPEIDMTVQVSGDGLVPTSLECLSGFFLFQVFLA
jgi:hypothetical protein